MRFVKPLIILSFVFSFVCAQAQQQPLHVSGNTYLPEYQGLSLNTFSDSRLHAKASLSPIVLEDAPGQRMMRVGKGLTIGGSVLLIGGVILMSTADEIFYTTTTTNGTTTEEGDPKGATGLTMAIGGVGMIIPGAIVWSKGKKKYAAYKATSASLSLGVNQNGAGLRFQF